MSGLTAEQVEAVLRELVALRNKAFASADEIDENGDECESSGECHAAASSFAYVRAIGVVRRAAGVTTHPDMLP